ncbi:glycerol-3-phosphate 1-O-acyltransferase PlsY [Albibacillus kandeliae]|uniref:glycerol-3-phosphate 1-O-acyltransferase PlsY n=1 Tax=Albibacillus kandeliae TaxID=2174228 RepID=UPI000D686A9E|nr:glycerol-3-phosphate 1-O-acyltransferase PlsY [Albibacillus kandeliae]
MPTFDTSLPMLLLWAVVGYGLGSIASGMIIARVMNLGDLRSIGSGNIGATNVLRTGNRKAAALTLVFDALKGVIAVLLARAVSGEDAAQVAAFFAFLGHCFPVWLGFKGGKGVATFLGVWLALAWPVGLACCATWLVSALITRISSLSALVAAASSTIWAFFLGYGQTALLGILLTLLVYWRHSANIARIKAGTEPKIGAK